MTDTAERKKAREEKQLLKLRKQLGRPEGKHYMTLMTAVLIIFNMFDLMATDLQAGLEEAITMFFAKLGASSQVWVKFDLWGQITEAGADYTAYQAMNGKIVLGSTIGFAFLAIAPFYKTLADKYGRRPFFIINCIGLMCGTFTGVLSYEVFDSAKTAATENAAIIMYITAQIIIVFFTIQDIQMLYVFEMVENSRRATVFGITKGMGFVAYIAVIAARLFNINNLAGIRWNVIFLGVGLFGAVSLFTAVFLLRESTPFLKERIAYLEKSEEERQREFSEKKREKQSFLGAMKVIFKTAQLRYLAFATLFVSVANNMVCSRANSIMSQNGMSPLYITIALLSATVIKAFANFAAGKLSDVLGRKPVVIILAVFNAVSMTLFCFVTNRITDMSGTDATPAATLNALLTGAMFGFAFASYLCIFDQISLMMSESTPTYIRSSVIGCMSAFRISATLALVLQSVLVMTIHIPTAWICYVLSVPFIIASAALIMLKVKETKGVTVEQLDI